VVLDFWTHSSMNCLHLLDILAAVERRFQSLPVQVVAIHSAKFGSERNIHNVEKALQRHDVRHPVLLDPERELWDRYGVRAWPTLVLIDAKGDVRHELQGEVNVGQLSGLIQALLDEGFARGLLVGIDRGAPAPPTPPSAGGGDRADPATSLRFPGKVSAHEDRVFISDTGGHRILVCSQEGRLLQVLGRGAPGAQDGPPPMASFRSPQGCCFLDGILYVADTGNHLLRAVDLDAGWVGTIAGTGQLGTQRGARAPSRPLETALRSPWDVVGIDGKLLISMAGSHQIWIYDLLTNEIGAFAGTGAEGHVDGPLHEAAFAQPCGLCWTSGHLMISDSESSSVRAIDAHAREALTLVGAGRFDFGDRDGPAEETRLQHPLDVAARGTNLYVADSYNNKIKLIDLPSLRTRTLFGTGSPELLHEPGGLCVVGERLLVADTNNHRLRWADLRTGTLEEFRLSD
jgi:hypothetical protein